MRGYEDTLHVGSVHLRVVSGVLGRAIEYIPLRNIAKKNTIEKTKSRIESNTVGWVGCGQS